MKNKQNTVEVCDERARPRVVRDFDDIPSGIFFTAESIGPVLIEDGVVCLKVGASVVHFPYGAIGNCELSDGVKGYTPVRVRIHVLSNL